MADEPNTEGGGMYGLPPSPPPKELEPIPQVTMLGERAGVETTPPPESDPDNSPAQPYGTDKSLDDPADANLADIANAISEGPWESAPAPFRKRDGFPDLTTESVNLRMLKDYYPADTGRHQNGDLPRGRRGELVAFPPDEAISLIELGYAERADDDAKAAEKAQKKRDEARVAEAKAAEDERKRLRDG